jgi:phosphomevalonate kinase
VNPDPPRAYFAPGKVVVLGEYAVLDGAPALVAAVDHGVRCDVTPGPTLTIVTPDADDRFVRPALVAAQAAPSTYTFRAQPPREGAKLGLGTSAAATVVAVLAGRASRGEAVDPASLRALAARVHREVQGSGSGLDVAASCFGGLSLVAGDDVRSVHPPVLAVVDSGGAAATGPRVGRYLGWADRAAFVAASTALVDAFEADPVAAMRAAYEALVAMARAADLPYLTRAHERIVAIARECGGAAKPSGAGGGDIAVAVFPDPDARTFFLDRCTRAGLPPVPVRLAPGAAPLEAPR